MNDKVKVDDKLEIKDSDQNKVGVTLEGIIIVNKTFPPESREEKIQIRPFKTDVARVAVTKGRTINIGDYNSARVDITISLPCYVEEIDATFEYCSKLVEQYLMKECMPIDEFLKGKQDEKV